MQPYVSSGLRALRRGAVAGTAALTMLSPVFGQEKLKSGIYAIRDASGKTMAICELAYRGAYPGEKPYTNCRDGRKMPRFEATAYDGKIIQFGYGNSLTLVKDNGTKHKVEDKPFRIIQNGKSELSWEPRTRFTVGNQHEEAIEALHRYNALAKEVMQPENCVSSECK